MTLPNSADSAAGVKTGRTSWATPLLAVLLVVAIILAGFSVYQEQQVTEQAGVVTALPSCPGKLIWNTQASASAVLILSMEPNSTAIACVIYQTPWRGNVSAIEGLYGSGLVDNTSTTFKLFSPFEWKTGFSIGDWTCVQVPNALPGICENEYKTSNFAVEASPTSVNVTASTDYVRVMYTITALSNSTGYYGNILPYSSVPLQCLETVWLVVGQPPAAQEPSGWGSTGSCPIGGLGFNPVAVSLSAVGMGVTYSYPSSDSTTA